MNSMSLYLLALSTCMICVSSKFLLIDIDSKPLEENQLKEIKLMRNEEVCQPIKVSISFLGLFNPFQRS